ncbi:hypothetical protein KQX54_002706 [Cotesia glomerata]|uniref:Uncharacterized protein n=1 Tax=Cotesia glomerata TaxID=32391 RepID=A0AAV7IMW1_COTGL|nr:hypothetical protein KQX54_002706 [Cotesia glomerata]
MDFISYATNCIPVVGHVKGLVHYAAGDTRGGNQAMFQATRTTVVAGAGTAGALAGPVGAVYFGTVAQLATDGLGSAMMAEPQGVVWGCSEISRQCKEIHIKVNNSGGNSTLVDNFREVNIEESFKILVDIIGKVLESHTW